MDGSISHLFKGIVGECGGGLACATCHCYVDEAWLDRVSPPSDAEKEMLEGVAGELQAGSRLSCQLTIGPALDGLVVRRSEERRVGKEGVSSCRSRWSTDH